MRGQHEHGKYQPSALNKKLKEERRKEGKAI